MRLYPLSLLVSAAIAFGQSGPAAGSLEDILRQARKEILNFQKAGGTNRDLGHPAEQWARQLWKWRETQPGTPEAAKATTEAVRFLVYSDRFTEAQSRVDRIPTGDPAWQGLARVLLDSAARQKDYTYFFAKLQSVFNETTDATTRAAVQLNLGRAWRRQRDEKKAEIAFRSAMDLAADSRAGKEAETQLYELLHLGAGKPAPAFSAAAIDGARLSLADYRGKPVVVLFWATYCADCVAEVPLVKQLYGKYHDRGFEIIGVSLDDDPAKVGRFVAQRGIPWSQLCDGKADAGAIPKLYNATGTPDLFVIDREGNIVTRLEGAKQLDRHLTELIASNNLPR